MSEGLRPIGPLVDIGVPLSREDFREGKFVRAARLLVGLVPWGPIDHRHGAVTGDDPQVFGGKRLFAPVARRGDNGRFFAREFFKLFDALEGDRVLGFAKVHVGAEIRALGRREQFLSGGSLSRRNNRHPQDGKSDQTEEGGGAGRRTHGSETVAVRCNFPHPTSAPRIACRMDFQMT